MAKGRWNGVVAVAWRWWRPWCSAWRRAGYWWRLIVPLQWLRTAAKAGAWRHPTRHSLRTEGQAVQLPRWGSGS